MLPVPRTDFVDPFFSTLLAGYKPAAAGGRLSVDSNLIFDPVNGICNHLVVEVFEFTDVRRNLIGEPGSALLVVILFDIWKHFPIAFLRDLKMVLKKQVFENQVPVFSFIIVIIHNICCYIAT